MSIKAKVTTQNTINAQVNPNKKIIPKQVTTGGGAALTDGDGIADFTYTGATPSSVAVDNTVLRTSGNQTVAGTKTFTLIKFLCSWQDQKIMLPTKIICLQLNI